MTVERVLEHKGRQVTTVLPEHSVADAGKLLEDKRIGAAVVTDQKGRIIGLLSERDLVRGMGAYGSAVMSMPVRNLMSSEVVTCTPQDSVKSLLELMTNRRFRHLPVVEDGQLTGIISIGDLVHRRITDQELELGVLRDQARMRA